MSGKPVTVIVSYYFAPNPQVGAKRFSFLAPEFERRGFDVHAIAAKSVHSDDPSLPVGSQVHRVRAPGFPVRGGAWARTVNKLARRLLAHVGSEYFWTGPAVRAAMRLGLQERRGVVIGTVPPFSAAIVATRIARNLDWPLILDYRDPWTAYQHVSRSRGGWQRSGWSRALASRLERSCVARSSARVFSTPEMKASFEEFFSQADRKRNFVIPNGVQLPMENARGDATSMRDIVHAGALYGDRSLLPTLRALAAISREDSRYSDVRLVQYGELMPAERQAIEAEKLQHLVVEKSRIPRESLWPVLCAARVLLVVSGSEMTYSIPYKVYDYLGARRPILALSPNGSAVQRMFTEYRIGSHVDPNDPSALRAVLRSLLDTEVYDVDEHAVQRHVWSRLAMDYAQIIDLVRGSAEPPHTHSC